MRQRYFLKSPLEAEIIFEKFQQKGWSIDLLGGGNSSISECAQKYFNQYRMLVFDVKSKNIGGNYVFNDEGSRSLSEIFELLNVFPKPEIVLNDKYKAVVNDDGSVEVGCQTIKGDVILKLAEIVKQKMA
jgi:hypothetical protein